MFQDEEFDLDLDDDPFPDNPVAPPSRPSGSADPPSVTLYLVALLFDASILEANLEFLIARIV